MDEIEAESENKVQLREDADVIKEKLSDILPRFLNGSELKKELNFEFFIELLIPNEKKWYRREIRVSIVESGG